MKNYLEKLDNPSFSALTKIVRRLLIQSSASETDVNFIITSDHYEIQLLL